MYLSGLRRNNGGNPLKIEVREISNNIREELKEKYEKKVKPILTIIRVGNDPASEVYVGFKVKACTSVGFSSNNIIMKSNSTFEEVKNRILKYVNKSNGVILQLPLPKALQEYEQELLDLIPHNKDVDGLGTENFLKLHKWSKDRIIPATPRGILTILEAIGEELEGKNITLIGRGKTVCQPLIPILMKKNATVTICHSRTKNLKDHLKGADIIISAVGMANFIDVKDIGANQVLIDVGMARNSEGKVTGDFNKSCYEVAKKYTTTPGGTGVMTVTSILQNLDTLCEAYDED